MPYGAAQIAARRAGRSGTPTRSATGSWRFEARMLATTAYTYGGEPAKSFVTFSWCLAEFDRDPAPFHARTEHDLLWHFKYMVSALTEVPRGAAGPHLRGARRHGAPLPGRRPQPAGGATSTGTLVARHVGDRRGRPSWYERWSTDAPRRPLRLRGLRPDRPGHATCASRGRDEEAVALAEPVLAGRLTCTEQPQTILTALLVPYLRTGRLEEAARRAPAGVPAACAATSPTCGTIGDHIAFCALTGNEARGLEIVQRHLDWLDRAPSPAAAMDFAAVGGAAAAPARRAGPRRRRSCTAGDQRRTSRPPSWPRELAACATALAARFDARNGTDDAEPADRGRDRRRAVRRRPAAVAPSSRRAARRGRRPAPKPVGAGRDPGRRGRRPPCSTWPRSTLARTATTRPTRSGGRRASTSATPRCPPTGDPRMLRAAAGRCCAASRAVERADDQDGTRRRVAPGDRRCSPRPARAGDALGGPGPARRSARRWPGAGRRGPAADRAGRRLPGGARRRPRAGRRLVAAGADQPACQDRLDEADEALDRGGAGGRREPTTRAWRARRAARARA